MKREGMTVHEAVEAWITEMDAIQQGMIALLMKYKPDDWSEVTMPSVGNRVYVYNTKFAHGSGEIVSHKKGSDKYKVKLDGGKTVSVKTDEFEVEYDDVLPMWGTMWSFGDCCDDHWLEDEGGIEVMSSHGIRVFEHDEWGYFFGIDGAGYDFYESHWIPLYRARGLHWHDPATEKKEASA